MSDETKKAPADMTLFFEAMQRVDDEMRPCFKCSMDDTAFRVAGRTETIGGVKITTVSLDENGACSNCGHITTAEEHAKLAERRKIMDAAWKAHLTRLSAAPER